MEGEEPICFYSHSFSPFYYTCAQIRLTNDGVPFTVIDSDAPREVPHNCVIQHPWTLSQAVRLPRVWDYDSDEPLLRVTLVRFTKLGSTSIGLSATHVCGTSGSGYQRRFWTC